MSGRVEDCSCDVKGVGDDYDMFDIMVSDRLVYITTNGKELSFSCGNIDSPVQSFDDRFVKGVNVRNGSSDLVLDTHI